MAKHVQINIELQPDEALALAQLVKRIGYSDVRSNAVNQDETYTMLDALAKVQLALANAGYAPR